MTISSGSASSKPFTRAIRAGRVLGGDRIGQDIARAGEGGGVGGVLLVAPLDEHHADVEGKRRDDQQGDEPTGEQDENLSSLVRRDLGLVVDNKARLRCRR